MDSRKHEARVAGVLYLLLAVASVIGLTYMPSWVMTGGDAAATASAIARSPMRYRIGVASDLASQILFVFLVLQLQQLFKGVSERQATLMVALVLVQVPMAFANMLVGIAPLILLSGADYWSAFDQQQLEALAMGFVTLRGYGISAVMALWGLWLLPFGLLVFRSGFIPRILGILLVVACFAYLVVGVTSLLVPEYARPVSYVKVLAIGEILIILWLVIKGAQSEVQPSVRPQ